MTNSLRIQLQVAQLCRLKALIASTSGSTQYHQAKTAAKARALIDDAIALESAGAFGIVLECVPAEVARIVTERLSIPTIGIGAGPFCDGQILVFHDLVGLTESVPRFVKRYASLADEISRAVGSYTGEVREGSFPAPENSYKIASRELEALALAGR